jgi:hypothetical protein
MKKILMMVAAAMMVALGVQAQKIQTVDGEGNAIPLVTVLDMDGNMIGTTNINGELADVKGAAKVTVTHVAYKPQIVTIASLQNGRITMEALDYGLKEIVITPKPYLYVEYYFRAFRYIGDSLRAYGAGIYPAIFDIKKQYKADTRTHWSYGVFSNKANSWHGAHIENQVKSWIKGSSHVTAEKFLKDKKGKEKYNASLVQEKPNVWRVEIPNEKVGQIVHSNGVSRATLNGSRMQMYSNEIHGETKMLKKRQKVDYEYQYAEIFKLADEDNDLPDIARHLMTMNHWEYNSGKGRDIEIYYIYTVEHGFVDAATFKARSKELNGDYAGDMTLDDLQQYETAHNIPSLAPAQLEAIKALKKGQGK